MLQISRMSLIQVDLTFYMWLFFIVSQWLFQQGEDTSTSRQTVVVNFAYMSEFEKPLGTLLRAANCHSSGLVSPCSLQRSSSPPSAWPRPAPSTAPPSSPSAAPPSRGASPSRSVSEMWYLVSQICRLLANITRLRIWNLFFATTNNNLSLIIIARLLETSFLLHIRYATIISTYTILHP